MTESLSFSIIIICWQKRKMEETFISIKMCGYCKLLFFRIPLAKSKLFGNGHGNGNFLIYIVRHWQPKEVWEVCPKYKLFEMHFKDIIWMLLHRSTIQIVWMISKRSSTQPFNLFTFDWFFREKTTEATYNVILHWIVQFAQALRRFLPPPTISVVSGTETGLSVTSEKLRPFWSKFGPFQLAELLFRLTELPRRLDDAMSSGI